MTDKSKDTTSEPKKDESKLKKTGADEEDIEILKKYGKGPYTEKIKKIEEDVDKLTKNVEFVKVKQD